MSSVHSLGAWSFKAGMNKSPVHTQAHIQEVITKATQGSKFSIEAAKKDAILADKCSRIKSRILNLSKASIKNAETALNTYMEMMHKQWSFFSKVWVVLDFDAFFCAVAERDDPTLRGSPFAVGSSDMLCTASYEARRYGVRSALPGFIAKLLCPQLKIVPCAFDKYVETSQKAKEVIRNYDPSFRSYSLDEFILDLTPHCKSKGLLCDWGECGGVTSTVPRTPTREEVVEIEAIVSRLREEVTVATGGLTMSAGIGPSFLLAKVASNENKPNGQRTVLWGRPEIEKYLLPQPVRAIPGVGRVTEALIGVLGCKTVGDINARKGELWHALGERQAKFLLECSAGDLGRGGGEEEMEEEGGVGRKSLSKESTFSPTAVGAVSLTGIVEELCKEVSELLCEEGLLAGTVTLKVKSAEFQVSQHSTSFSKPTAKFSTIFSAALAMLKLVKGSVRLLGVRASSFVLAPTGPTALDKFLSEKAEVTFPGSLIDKSEGSGSDVEVLIEDVVDVTGEPEDSRRVETRKRRRIRGTLDEFLGMTGKKKSIATSTGPVYTSSKFTVLLSLDPATTVEVGAAPKADSGIAAPLTAENFSLTNSAIARCVKLSKRSNFGAMSRFKSQFAFFGISKTGVSSFKGVKATTGAGAKEFVTRSTLSASDVSRGA